MNRLSGKVCVVTGAGQGIGRGIARRFAREGATVLVADISEENGLEVAGDLDALGGDGMFVRTDVRQKEDVSSLIQTTYESFGRVDVLVNCAIAFAPHANLEDKSDDMWDFVLHVGFYAVVWAMQAVFPIMRDQGGGRIVNFDSRAADNGQLLSADYNSTKGAIGGLTRSAAAEWAKYNILCNAIAPAAASLGYHELIENDAEFRAYIASLPLGRVGDPEDDIAPVALFLASDDAQFVTGVTIRAEGGIDLAREAYFPADTQERIDEWRRLIS